MSQPSLRRSVGPVLLTLYGLGNIVGAGIYVLLGEVAGAAGSTAPLAFAVAMIVAALSALTYGELAACYPRASGEALYLERAFGVPALSLAAGLAIAVAGIVSAAALARGFAGYFAELTPVPNWGGIAGVVLILAGIAVWGIQQSLRASAVMTVVQVAGLLMVIAGLGGALAELPERADELVPAAPQAWMGLWMGGFLAFYAFIGFEDMVKVAEEVRRPRRNLPLAVLAALGGAALLYLVLAAGVVLALEPASLAGTEAPLVVIYEATTGRRGMVITLFGLVATLSGILAQLIMASRLLYGLAEEGWLPAVLARVSPRTRTPIPATVVVAGLVLILALAFPVVGLAGLTSALILAVFAGVNLALWRLRRGDPGWGVGIAPRWAPPIALAATLLLAAGGVASLVR
ncbi:APC family permease [Thiohalorhabdus sp.]|uniref:APC family permease n=1 Tax=Thiohalorhabdus sp. TaxID=3094134 RepID=UPI002FC3D1DB